MADFTEIAGVIMRAAEELDRNRFRATQWRLIEDVTE